MTLVLAGVWVAPRVFLECVHNVTGATDPQDAVVTYQHVLDHCDYFDALTSEKLQAPLVPPVTPTSWHQAKN